MSSNARAKAARSMAPARQLVAGAILIAVYPGSVKVPGTKKDLVVQHAYKLGATVAEIVATPVPGVAAAYVRACLVWDFQNGFAAFAMPQPVATPAPEAPKAE